MKGVVDGDTLDLHDFTVLPFASLSIQYRILVRFFYIWSVSVFSMHRMIAKYGQKLMKFNFVKQRRLYLLDTVLSDKILNKIDHFLCS